jgi:hypothetical protein
MFLRLRRRTWCGLTAHNPFFVHGKHGKLGKFFLWVAALTDKPAPPKFLCVKVGFTFSVRGDMERRRLAGMKPVSFSSLKNQKVQKKILKNEKTPQSQ